MSSSCNGSGSDIFLTCNISKLLKKARKNVIYFGLYQLMPDVPVHFIADQRTNNQWSQYM